MAPARTPSQVRRAKAFGARVFELRAARGWNMRELAARVSMSSSAISRIERGRSGPPHDEMVARLAAVLGADELELLHLAGRAIDPDAMDQRTLTVLRQLVDEQRAGFAQIGASLARLRCTSEDRTGGGGTPAGPP